MVTTDLLKVVENAAIELVNTLEAGLLHDDSRLFTADTPSAKSDYRFALEFVGFFFDDLGEFAEF